MLPQKYRKSEVLFPGFEDIFWDPEKNNPLKPEMEMKTFPIDVKEFEDYYEIKADLPGVSKKDISITFNENVLSISCIRSSESSEKNEEGIVIRTERFSSSSTRQIRFENEVDPKKINCSLKEGVLLIKAGKEEDDKSNSIDIAID